MSKKEAVPAEGTDKPDATPDASKGAATKPMSEEARQMAQRRWAGDGQPNFQLPIGWRIGPGRVLEINNG